MPAIVPIAFVSVSRRKRLSSTSRQSSATRRAGGCMPVPVRPRCSSRRRRSPADPRRVCQEFLGRPRGLGAEALQGASNLERERGLSVRASALAQFDPGRSAIRSRGDPGTGSRRAAAEADLLPGSEPAWNSLPERRPRRPTPRPSDMSAGNRPTTEPAAASGRWSTSSTSVVRGMMPTTTMTLHFGSGQRAVVALERSTRATPCGFSPSKVCSGCSSFRRSTCSFGQQGEHLSGGPETDRRPPSPSRGRP